MKTSRLVLFVVMIVFLIWLWYVLVAYQSNGSGTVTNNSNIQNIDFIDTKINSAE